MSEQDQLRTRKVRIHRAICFLSLDCSCQFLNELEFDLDEIEWLQVREVAREAHTLIQGGEACFFNARNDPLVGLDLLEDRLTLYSFTIRERVMSWLVHEWIDYAEAEEQWSSLWVPKLVGLNRSQDRQRKPFPGLLEIRGHTLLEFISSELVDRKVQADSLFRRYEFKFDTDWDRRMRENFFADWELAESQEGDPFPPMRDASFVWCRQLFRSFWANLVERFPPSEVDYLVDWFRKELVGTGWPTKWPALLQRPYSNNGMTSD